MISSRVVKSSNSQCQSCNCPGFDPSILRHSGIWSVADIKVVRKKARKKMSWFQTMVPNSPSYIMNVIYYLICPIYFPPVLWLDKSPYLPPSPHQRENHSYGIVGKQVHNRTVSSIFFHGEYTQIYCKSKEGTINIFSIHIKYICSFCNWWLCASFWRADTHLKNIQLSTLAIY